MTLPAGSSSPKAIRFTIRTGPVDGTTVASVRLRVQNPKTKAQQTWGPLVPSSATTSQVVVTYVLASDGSSVPQQGSWPVVAWLYDSGGAVLDYSRQGAITIGPALAVTPPT